ncbi:hypothetical protein PSC71_09035 [Devosia sp. J2-20]|uniref:hypothetical protein n=1 Tax=Devosia sp. J2-20 TaxID=3026161 RepID=UPI00249BA05A|nr:hypothetical protein [Devosia sp. J2-20]WDR00862.1 hypothetical protein PSC71_09035 [Devosia sp. J2-20]
MRYGQLLFAAYAGAVAYGFSILWFGEPLRILKDYQTLVIGLPTVLAAVIAYLHLRDDRHRYERDRAVLAEQEVEAMRVAIRMADFELMREHADLVQGLFEYPYRTYDPVDPEDLAFVVTHAKSYEVLRHSKLLSKHIEDHIAIAREANNDEGVEARPEVLSHLQLHEGPAEVAARRLLNAAKLRLQALL